MSDEQEVRVLVTGGAGFIGCAVSNLLAPNVARFVAFDKLDPQVHATAGRPTGLNAQAELVIGDVTDPVAVDTVLSDLKPTHVLHLAAETGTGQSLTEATRHGMANVIGTTQLCDAFGRTNVVPKRILLSSSRAVYGEGAWKRSDGSVLYPGQRPHSQLASQQWDFPDATSLPSEFNVTTPHPTSVYGATKLAQEHVLSAWCGAYDVPLSILRLQNVYGPGQSLINSYTGIVSLFSQIAADGKAIPLYEDGNVTRDFVYIDDVARAIADVLISARYGLRNEFDIGSGQTTTIEELASTIAEYHGAPGPNVTGAFRDGDVRHASCSIERTTSQLGWRPEWSLADGIGALQRWIADQN
jgi:dTDP-L-rhamnose 4-epimerase